MSCFALAGPFGARDCLPVVGAIASPFTEPSWHRRARRVRSRSRFRLRAASAGLLHLGGEEARLHLERLQRHHSWARPMDKRWSCPACWSESPLSASYCGSCGKSWWSARTSPPGGSDPWRQEWQSAGGSRARKRSSSSRRRHSAGKGKPPVGGKGKGETSPRPVPSASRMGPSNGCFLFGAILAAGIIHAAFHGDGRAHAVLAQGLLGHADARGSEGDLGEGWAVGRPQPHEGKQGVCSKSRNQHRRP